MIHGEHNDGLQGACGYQRLFLSFYTDVHAALSQVSANTNLRSVSLDARDLHYSLHFVPWVSHFVSAMSGQQLESLLIRVRCSDYELVERTMLDWRVLRDGDQVGAGTALNDVVVNKSALARIIDIDCWVGKHYVTGYRSDGLIVATATGSTAYNLAAGGPIIVPGAEAISICPICPHTLTNRPLVLPFNVEIRLQMNTREQEVMLTADGQTGLPLKASDRVEIRKSAKTFNTVCAKDRDYFEILRSKLRWSGR